MSKRGQQGHLIVGLVAAMAILAIFSLVAAQAWEDVIRRDNEAEMMFRADQIVRAIRKFRKAHGGVNNGPTTLDQLMEPGPKGEYFLRRLYTDPLVKDGKWGLLYAAPGGGVIDPNAPGVAEPLPIGQSSLQATDLAGGLSGFGDGPRELSGLPIVGVKSLSVEKPFRVYKGLADYSQWQFTIFDLESQQAGAQQPGGPAGGNRRQKGNAGIR